jgi:hypothetical protein
VDKEIGAMMRRRLLGGVLLLGLLGGCTVLAGLDNEYVLTEAGSADGAGSGGNGGSGCEPGTVQDCYSGPEGTEGVGACKGGLQACSADRSGYGDCTGEVTPEPEDCATAYDEDCDGEVLDEDAGCVCLPSTAASCYSGPAGTMGISVCAAGVEVCNELGTSYGPCVGEVVPAFEECGTAADENCDGEAACKGAHTWSKRFGDSSTQEVQSIATDGVGNVVLTGYFSGSVDFGGGPLWNTERGTFDTFVAKLDLAGTHLWSKRFGLGESQYAYSIATDSAGNIVLTGVLVGTADFGGGPLGSAGGNDVFVAKLSPTGSHLWSKRFGNVANQWGWSVSTDSAGNIVLTGWFGGTIDFGGQLLSSAEGSDIFVAKLDPAGNHLWSKSFGVGNDQYGRGIATDGAGNIVLTGDGFGIGSVDFGGGLLACGGLTDIFVVKLDPAGGHLWSKCFGDSTAQYSESIATDSAGNIVLTGAFEGTVDFGGQLLSSAGATDIFVAKLDPMGSQVWSKRFGDSSYERGNDIATDSVGNVVVTGDFEGTIDFGGGPYSNVGGKDVCVVKLEPSGVHLWSNCFGDSSHQQGQSVAVDGTGSVFLAGSLDGSADFGGGLLSSEGSVDIFVAKLAP